jgi:hypothetical protein
LVFALYERKNQNTDKIGSTMLPQASKRLNAAPLCDLFDKPLTRGPQHSALHDRARLEHPKVAGDMAER